MADAWEIAKWISAAVLAVYTAVQIAAVRRLSGDRRKRSQSILLGMVILEGFSISLTAGSREAHRIAAVVVGVAALVAISVLSQMLRSQRADGSSGNAGVTQW
jgi:hypothetical protein